jgi:beta-glucanase (GH16 family)
MAQAPSWLSLTAGSMTATRSASAQTALPYANMQQTFDYTPARDGLALVTGGPTQAGYAAGALANPAAVWVPRYSTATDPHGSNDSYYGEFEYYVDPEYPRSNHYSPFAIVNGNLRIRAQRTAGLNFLPNEVPNDPATGQPYTIVSGVLTTKQRFSQKAGYFEVIAQMPKGNAIWPAIWMLPVTEIHPPEIDINEYIGNGPAQYHVNVLTIGDNGTEHSFFCTAGEDLSLAYHAYGVMWTSTTITFYLDNNPVHAVDITGQFGFSDPFYILLNLAVGSREPNYVVPAPDATTPNPADMLIKSVRTWQGLGPTAIVFAGAQAVLENAAPGATVSALSCTSLSSTANAKYTIASDPDAVFAVVNNQLTTRSALSFAKAPYHTVIIKVADSQNRSWQQPFSIAVLDAGLALNTLLSQSDLTSAAWNKFALTIASGSPRAPNNTSLQLMMETAATSYHGVEQICAKPAKAINYVVSADFAPQGRSWVKCEISSNYVNPVQAFFNLATGQVGGVFDSGVAGAFSFGDCRMIPLGNGFYRCQLDITTDTNLALHVAWKLALSGSDYAQRPGDPTQGLMAKTFMRAVVIG